VDQVTQILLGATAAEAAFGPRLGWRAAVVGGAAGFAPDLDMLLRPFAPPLFPVEIHRTFAHSLVAVPVGALLVGGLFAAWKGYRRHGLWLVAAAFVGWLTHGPLDACTSYGTMLLWPFDRTWIAWDLISILDPVYSLTLLVGLVWALKARRTRPAWIALALACLYLGAGYLQRERAAGVQQRLARARGDRIEHGRVIPVLGGLVFWRSLYRSGGRVHADQVRLLPGREPAVLEAGSQPVFAARDLPPDLVDRAGVVPVFRRFRVFADGFTTRLPEHPDVVGDLRYTLTAGFTPAWGIRVVAGERPAWVELASFRRPDLERLAGSMLGTAGTYVPLAALLHPPAAGSDGR
jgi:inner membrane protein